MKNAHFIWSLHLFNSPVSQKYRKYTENCPCNLLHSVHIQIEPLNHLESPPFRSTPHLLYQFNPKNFRINPSWIISKLFQFRSVTENFIRLKTFPVIRPSGRYLRSERWNVAKSEKTETKLFNCGTDRFYKYSFLCLVPTVGIFVGSKLIENFVSDESFIPGCGRNDFDRYVNNYPKKIGWIELNFELRAFIKVLYFENVRKSKHAKYLNTG